MKDFEEKEELLEEDFESGGATVTVHRIGRVLKILAPTPLAYPVSDEKQYSLMRMVRYTTFL